jgi:hypothetical protein
MSVAFTTYADFKTEFKTLKNDVTASIGTSDKYSVLKNRLDKLVERIEGLNPQEKIQAQAKLASLTPSIEKMYVRMTSNKSWETVNKDLANLSYIMPPATYAQRRNSVAGSMSPGTGVASSPVGS